MAGLSLLTACVAGLLLGADPASLPNTPFDTVIAVDQVEVRSGASQEFYTTSVLRKSDKVRVLKVENGWLGIEPPHGSFSWINNRLVRREGPSELVVLAPDGAPVRMGSTVVGKKPVVVGAHLERGTIVTIAGDPHAPKDDIPEDGGKWWPILPLNEVRWIPRDAVQLTPTVETVASVPASDSKKVAPQDTWAQAEQAERANDLSRAMQLYAATAAASPDRNLQMQCYNRIQFLKEGNHGSVPPGYQPGRPAEAATGDFRPIASAPTNPSPVPTQSQAVGYGPRPVPTQITNPGRLRRAGFYVDNRQAYVLEDNQGRPQVYATAQAGVDLDSFVNRIVTLSGTISYRSDLRTNYMTAVQVKALP
jgi:uncharacterized protein YgiM (DUF1202 family)